MPASSLLKAATRPGNTDRPLVSRSSHEVTLKADRFPDLPQSSADVRARHSWLSAAASARVRALALHLSIRIVPAAQNTFARNSEEHTLNVAPRENDVSATHSK